MGEARWPVHRKTQLRVQAAATSALYSASQSRGTLTTAGCPLNRQLDVMAGSLWRRSEQKGIRKLCTLDVDQVVSEAKSPQRVPACPAAMLMTRSSVANCKMKRSRDTALRHLKIQVQIRPPCAAELNRAFFLEISDWKQACGGQC